MLAGGTGGKGKIVMQTGRSTDDDRIDVVSCKEIFGALEDGPLHQSRGVISGSRIGIGGGYQFYAAHASQGGQVYPIGDVAASDDAYSKLPLHALTLPGQ